MCRARSSSANRPMDSSFLGRSAAILLASLLVAAAHHGSRHLQLIRNAGVGTGVLGDGLKLKPQTAKLWASVSCISCASLSRSSRIACNRQRSKKVKMLRRTSQNEAADDQPNDVLSAPPRGSLHDFQVVRRRQKNGKRRQIWIARLQSADSAQPEAANLFHPTYCGRPRGSPRNYEEGLITILKAKNGEAAA